MPTKPFDDITVSELLNVMYARRDALSTSGYPLTTHAMQRQIDTTINYANLTRERKDALRASNL